MKPTIYIIFVLMMASFTLAGTVSNDCTRTETYCDDYDRVCTHWKWGHCIHWHNVCISYAERCTDSTESTGNVDADTLGGETADDIKDDIMVNDDRWSKDEIGGGGMGKSGLSHYLFGNQDLYKYDYYNLWVIEKIDQKISELNDRIDIIEARQILIWNHIQTRDSDFYATNMDVSLQAAHIKSKRIGSHVNIEDFECNGKCIRLSDIE